MIRAVLAVVLATTLVALALPGIDHARVSRTDRLLEGEVTSIQRAADSLLTTDEAAPLGARRTVTVRLPRRSWSSAGVTSLRVRGVDGPDRTSGRGSVVYRVAGGDRRRHWIDAPLYVPDGPIVLEEPGTHRLTLTLVRVEGQKAIRVQR